nr:hypothetical protein Itr_chr13CG13680 [Ipomoea trifida]
MLRIDSPTPRARFAGANGCFGWCCAPHAILNVPRKVTGAPPLALDSHGRSGHTPGYLMDPLVKCDGLHSRLPNKSVVTVSSSPLTTHFLRSPSSVISRLHATTLFHTSTDDFHSTSTVYRSGRLAFDFHSITPPLSGFYQSIESPRPRLLSECPSSDSVQSR